MPRVFLSNFDFEHRLAGVNRSKAGDIAADLSSTWLAITNPDDAIPGLRGVDDGFESELACIGRRLPQSDASPGYTAVPWGWDSDSHEEVKRNGWHSVSPEPHAVARVNSRWFSFALEQQLECGLPGAKRIESVDAFEAISRTADQWVVKAEFSMSSRERILGSGRANESHKNWVAKRLAENGVVFFEPWVKRTEEAAAQFEIDEYGVVKFVGVTGLLTTQDGRFAGCWITEADGGWKGEIAVAQHAAKAAGTVGYFGPLGIDMARYELGQEIGFRPIQDFNGRYTMGRLALGFRSCLDAKEHAAWLFLPWSRNRPGCETFASIRERLPAGARVVRTSPFQLGQHQVRLGTVLLIADDASLLREACRVTWEMCG
jgi:hypothetical protein